MATNLAESMPCCSGVQVRQVVVGQYSGKAVGVAEKGGGKRLHETRQMQIQIQVTRRENECKDLIQATIVPLSISITSILFSEASIALDRCRFHLGSNTRVTGLPSEIRASLKHVVSAYSLYASWLRSDS